MSALIYGIWRMTSFLAIVTWRFYSGRPMNGKTIDNSSFLEGATRGKPGKRLTRWQKKPQLHRALIRVAVLWPIIGLVVLLIWNRQIALLVCAFLFIPLGFLAVRKLRLLFFAPYMITDAGNGKRTQCWRLRSKYRRLFRMQPVPGLVTRRNRIDPDLPHELKEAMKADINAQLMDGEMPVTELKRYKRKSVKS